MGMGSALMTEWQKVQRRAGKRYREKVDFLLLCDSIQKGKPIYGLFVTA